MSATIATSPFASTQYLPSASVSDEGAWLRKLLEGIQRRFFLSEALSGARRNVFNQLLDVYQECSAPDWDGAGALPVSAQSLGAAGSFLQALPSSSPMPEVSADAQGEIHLEWYGSPRRVFTVSFGSNALHFAGRFGAGTVRGREAVGSSVPETVMMNIRRVFE
jgi:hypothetical protein